MAKAKTIDPAPQAATTATGRLAGKVALVTGAAGNLGGYIVRHYLAEGATVVMTGRTEARLEAAAQAMREASGVDATRLATVILDGGNAQSVRDAVADVVRRFGQIDILVNNAGSAGPKQTIEQLPFDEEELAALQKRGANDTETVPAAMRNIFGVAWNLARTVAAAMPEGGSIINVSTIFSRTPYYARAAYVVPKAAMNAWSRELSLELGPRGIRVNLVFPGPIESERIRTVFAAMDKARGDEDGTTANTFFDMMSLERSTGGAPKAKTFPVPDDIATTCVFLGSDESAAYNGHDFEVTHGMTVRKEERATYLARPTMRSMDGAGLAILIVAGENWEEALEIARIQINCGTSVLLGVPRQADVAIAQARAKAEGIGPESGGALTIVRFNRTEPASIEAALADYTESKTPITGAIFLPVFGPGEFGGRLVDAEDDMIDTFMDVELVGAMALARTLSRYWKRHGSLLQAPRFIFMSNASDGKDNVYANVLRAAIEQLIRIWRDESEIDVAHGRRRQGEWGNQIVRFTNAESECTRFAAGHAARVLIKESKIAEVTLYVPRSIGEATGARKAMAGFSENITGLHLGKVALITGGSAGIGGQVARLLALAGGKVMMVARRESELAVARARIVSELEDIGFAGVERRVQTMAGMDVSNLDSLKAAVDATIKAFGRIDYLINNAGVAGAEEMVVDMSVDAWNYTLDANLISNFVLMHHVVPLMKAQGSGYVLNVSSYFGGEKYLAVAYPNRADYAASKSGQRAMVESMARHLGPEVQFNAIAPGPVDGDRLSGTGGKPGLFERRGKLILANKRLNAIHAAAVKSLRRGVRVEALLSRLSRNDTVRMSHDTNNPREIRELALACAREGDGVCTWDRYLMTPDIAAKLVSRLRGAGYFLDSPEWGARPATPEADRDWLLKTPPEDQPFLPADKIAVEAKKVGTGVLSQLFLGKMPTETDVAQATVFFLADRAVSGETFMPSGGLSVERSTTERELFGSPKQERLDQMRGRTVWMIGEHLTDYLAETARQFIADCHVARVVMMTGSEAGYTAVKDQLDDIENPPVEYVALDGGVEAAMDEAIRRWGHPTTIVSTPMQALPTRLFATDALLTPEEFRGLVKDNLTNHFRVARKASLYDDCQLVLVSPDVPMGDKSPAFALANFIKTTLHSFTATLAVENERLVHGAPVNQINLTRRVRSEEPRDLDEHLEEVKRFARAVLLVGTPLPDAEDSRYRARIYRGMSMTV
ncbi:SDR family NAD(P)-dependent oxidoreductase [Novosphingobium sp. AAP93]|uniref:SDR family NAD(P)-dependent oxidoreductase n=1 Tax=Novosphingobium sp. AAP93 TaxID=1523427 RepID=UPI0006B895B5|nr:SDR family NAD(P)-dependent oxidoreductase [Novosphingobium sp. AAP93]KPF80805.1 NAD-dependent dehydratase [Novosphingobium sp. AAP93]